MAKRSHHHLSVWFNCIAGRSCGPIIRAGQESAIKRICVAGTKVWVIYQPRRRPPTACPINEKGSQQFNNSLQMPFAIRFPATFYDNLLER